MTNGWIKVHRQIMEKGWWRKSEFVHLWLHLLLQVVYTEKEYVWNGKTIQLKPGQLVTGRDKLGEETGMPGWKVQRILNFFEKENQIAQQTSNTSRLITIVNYASYQGDAQPVHNDCTTSAQQLHTKKESKESKEKKKPFSEFT